ncbi:MAG: putative sulfate/molybdate transporter [Gemmatimonadetes bacterium]|nr:putative sulfate/molybdate transporter [Gemmatimonadota bacterium]
MGGTSSTTAGTIRFDRNEVSGAFGDLGTSLPLIIGMITAAHLDATSVLLVYGVLQIATGLVYRMPMPVQPLKAVAAIVIAQQISGDVIAGGGLAIGVLMLVLAVTGALDWLGRVVPKVVVRGIQVGLAIQLGRVAVANYIPAGGTSGYVLAGLALLVTVVLIGNRRVPPAPIIIAAGAIYAVTVGGAGAAVIGAAGMHMPTFHVPTGGAVWEGFLLLSLAQIPLSLGNSVLATRQITADLFPTRPPLTLRKIGVTYAAMNLFAPWFGGIPVCHGSGGIAGHYAFGARTGGSVIIIGSLTLAAGLLFGGSIGELAMLFPAPVLGVLLLVESVSLFSLARDVAGDARGFALVGLIALIAAALPYGYVVALVLGTILARSGARVAAR